MRLPPAAPPRRASSADKFIMTFVCQTFHLQFYLYFDIGLPRRLRGAQPPRNDIHRLKCNRVLVLSNLQREKGLTCSREARSAHLYIPRQCIATGGLPPQSEDDVSHLNSLYGHQCRHGTSYHSCSNANRRCLHQGHRW
jgi:hypothetical protein